jgi:hypothetical protein
VQRLRFQLRDFNLQIVEWVIVVHCYDVVHILVELVDHSAVEEECVIVRVDGCIKRWDECVIELMED